MNKNIDLGLLILRIAIGTLMLLHGLAKFNGLSFIEGLLTNNGLPSVLAYGVYITEIIAPLLIILGYRTRLASSIYAFGVLFAMFLVHSADIISLNNHGGWGVELLGLYLFGSITLFFTGSGEFAVSSSHKWD